MRKEKYYISYQWLEDEKEGPVSLSLYADGAQGVCSTGSQFFVTL